MEIQVNPNGWSCLPTAFAMALGCSVRSFISLIGHDGSGEPYDVPGLKAGFHEQECIEAAHRLGWACTPIEVLPCISPHVDGHDARTIIFGVSERDNWGRFITHLDASPGVITGVYTGRMPFRGHAVAWEPSKALVYDPRGGLVYPFEKIKENHLTPRCFWKTQKVN